MKHVRDNELTMLEIVVQPKIQEAKKCLQEGKMEEMWQIIARDVLGLLKPYKDSEMEKYNNAPDSLLEAPNVKRMYNNAKQYQTAINLLWDEETNTPRPVDENTLNAVDNIVDNIIHS